MPPHNHSTLATVLERTLNYSMGFDGPWQDRGRLMFERERVPSGSIHRLRWDYDGEFVAYLAQSDVKSLSLNSAYDLWEKVWKADLRRGARGAYDPDLNQFWRSLQAEEYWFP